MKSNVAAAVLLRAGWPELAARGGWLVDPDVRLRHLLDARRH